jgi:hypothetical protein
MKYSTKRFFLYLFFYKFLVISSGGVYADIAPVNIHCPCEIERVNQTKAVVTFYIAFQKEVDESGDLNIQIYGSDRITSFYANSLSDLGNRNLDSIPYSPSPVKVRAEVPLVSSQEAEIFISLVLSNSTGTIDQVNFIEDPIHYKNLGGSYWQASSRLMFNSPVIFDYDGLNYSVYIESITSTDLKSQNDNITGEIVVSDGSSYYKKSAFEYSINFDEAGIGTLKYESNLDYEIDSQFDSEPEHKFVYLKLYRDGNLFLSYLLEVLGEDVIPDVNGKWTNINTLKDSDGDKVSDFNERLVGTSPLVFNKGSGAVIEVAFTVGSSAEASEYGGVNLNATIEHNLEVANAAFKDSGLNIELKNIGVYSIGEDYRLDASEVIDALLARQSIFTDLDTMLTRQPDLIIHYSSLESIGIGGLAPVLGSNNDGIIDFKNSYKDGTNRAVVAIDNTSLTLAHEIGHLLGLTHSRRQVKSISTGTFPWSLGYGVDSNFATIMAYASEFDSSQIGVFSSPNSICGDQKLPCGIDYEDHLIGADAVSSLAVTAFQVSAISNGFPPTITLIGNDSIDIVIGETYTETGFSAFDKEDGNLTSSVVVSDNIDNTKTGAYKIDYNVSDADNNLVIMSRIVNVIADTDGDSIPDEIDDDIDGDGYVNAVDIFPYDSLEWFDSDGDSAGDNADPLYDPESEVTRYLINRLDQCDGNKDVRVEFEINGKLYPPIEVRETMVITLARAPSVRRIYRNGVLVSSSIDGNSNMSDIYIIGWGCNWEAFNFDSDLPSLIQRYDSDEDGIFDYLDAFPVNALFSSDGDSDGMPDAWEIRYGLNPNDASDANGDQDNDGVAALDEFLAGTIPAGSLDIDGNGQYDALTDGLLLLRGMFLLSGDSLISDAVASDAVYKTSDEVASRIDMLGDLVDIDGNGSVDALTDGLVILRYLFNLRGDVLINDVIASDATVKTAEDIEAKIEQLIPSL